MTYKFYRGFSTRNYQESGGSLALYNVKLIEEDLMNELFTVKGERLMMPEFGTRIPLLIFEPNDTDSQDVLREDIETVINHDPRVQLQALDVIVLKDKSAMIAIAKVKYLEFNVVQDLHITVNSR